MSYQHKPEYVVALQGSNGQIEHYRTDDLENAEKNAKARGFKIVSTELSKRATPEIKKGSPNDPNVKVDKILAKARRDPSSVTGEELDFVREYSQNYAKLSAKYETITPGYATKSRLSDHDYTIVKSSENAKAKDDEDEDEDEDAKARAKVKADEDYARSYARNYAKTRGRSRSKAASMNIPNAEPRSVSMPDDGRNYQAQPVDGVGDWESEQVTGDEPFAEGYDQADIDTFNKWMSGLDRKAVVRQGVATSELFTRYMQAEKPQVMSFEPGMKAPRPDSQISYSDSQASIVPKGGPANQ